MATKSRNRLVNFRVDENEFQALKELTETSGARSMSDLARNRTLGNNNSEPINAEMILNKVDRLEHQIAGLTAMMAELLGRSAAPAKPQQEEQQVINGGLPH